MYKSIQIRCFHVHPDMQIYANQVFRSLDQGVQWACAGGHSSEGKYHFPLAGALLLALGAWGAGL